MTPANEPVPELVKTRPDPWAGMAEARQAVTKEVEGTYSPALKLGQQVGRLGDVEGARSDEQDMVGLDRPIFGRDGGALDQRQEVPLYAFAGGTARNAAFAAEESGEHQRSSKDHLADAEGDRCFYD